MFHEFFDRRAEAWQRVTVHVRARLMVPVLVVGLAGGVVGAIYLGVLHLLTVLIGPPEHGVWIQGLVLVGAGAFVAIGTRVLGPTGNVELLVDNIHVSGESEGVRQTLSMIPQSLACIAAGGSLGPEAPLVQATGTIGSWWGRRLDLDRDAVRILTITGMAAGFTVLFGAPLGGALFALEILHRRGLQYYEAIIPALLGSLAGYGVAAVALRAGLEPIWEFPAAGPLASTDLLWAVGAGIAGGLMAWVFGALVEWTRRLYALVPASVRPVLGGLSLGLLAAASPYVLTNGEMQLNDVLAAKLTVGALLVAFAAKLLGTIVTMASGWKGGFIIPLFFLGAITGELVHALVPSANEPVVAVALMVSFCVGVTKTPLGSTLVVTEMAGVALLPTAIIAAVVALVLSERVQVIETQRDRSAEDGEDPDVRGGEPADAAPTEPWPPGPVSAALDRSPAVDGSERGTSEDASHRAVPDAGPAGAGVEPAAVARVVDEIGTDDIDDRDAAVTVDSSSGVV